MVGGGINPFKLVQQTILLTYNFEWFQVHLILFRIWLVKSDGILLYQCRKSSSFRFYVVEKPKAVSETLNGMSESSIWCCIQRYHEQQNLHSSPGSKGKCRVSKKVSIGQWHRRCFVLAFWSQCPRFSSVQGWFVPKKPWALRIHSIEVCWMPAPSQPHKIEHATPFCDKVV